MAGASCTTWGPSAWGSGKCDMKTGTWYPDGMPDDVRAEQDSYLERLRLEVAAGLEAEEEAMFELIDDIRGVDDFEVPVDTEMTGTDCRTWGPTAWESGKCDMKTGNYFYEGVPEFVLTLGEPIISDMPSNIQPQRMRVKAQGSTVNTHLTTKEIAKMTFKPGAEGIYIPAHFPDFVKPTVLHNIYPTTVSYYLAYSGPEERTRQARPGLFYPFIVDH